MGNKPNGKLFLIVGPSGVGKGTVIFHLKKRHPEFDYPISVTTRKPRPKEKDGVVYHFVTHEEFKKMIQAGELLEYAVVHNKEYYGTLKAPILDALNKGHTVVREVDMQGCESIQKVLSRKNVISVFLTVPDKQDLINRILKRGKLPKEEIRRRMESAEKEFAKGGKVCNYQVPSLNGKITECVDKVEALILSEVNGS